MRKIALLVLIFTSLASCKDDEEPTPVAGYPTDDLVFTEQTNSLLLFSYNTNSGVTASYELIRKLVEDRFGDTLNHMSLVYDSNLPLFSTSADTLSQILSVGLAPDFYYNQYAYNPSIFDILVSDISAFNKRKPIASISHAVTKTDSAWIVDNKIKFWKDTSGSHFTVETYYLNDVVAASYWSSLGIDLRIGSVNGVVNQGDSISTWEENFYNLDSSNLIVTAGERYVHNYVMVDNFSESSVFGDPISDYTPFNLFSFNDVIGTSSTPIRHYFLRPGHDDDPSDDILYEFEPVFLSVIWAYDALDGTYTAINSYMSKSDNN